MKMIICMKKATRCTNCNTGACKHRLQESGKPNTFSMNKYREAIVRIEELEAVNKALEETTIRQRIQIYDLFEKYEKLKLTGPTVTGQIEAVKAAMCDLCINTKECANALETGAEYPCPMDAL